MSANDKFRLGYGDHKYDGILSYENEVLQSVFMNKESELEKQPLYDRFVTAGGMHAVPPPMTGNYMPSGPDVEIDYSSIYICHLIRDCDFHEKRMAKQAELNNKLRKKSSQREIRPIWNNVQRVNHQNQFVPTAVLTRTGKISVSTARASGTNNDYAHRTLQNKGIIDSGCSRYMTGNKAYLAEYQNFNGGPVAFGGSKGYITGKDKIKTGKLNFEDVCFVKELQHFNLFSVSQICNKKNKVFFTDFECLVLSPEFKLPDANQVLLRIPRQNNMYSFNFENIVPSGGIKREYSNARTPQQNGVAERKNRTLIEAARTMLADSFLPNTFWAEAVSTACYVLNRFDGKSDEGFLVGYSLQSKAFRVYNLETKRVEENLHITFLENKPNVAGKGPTWLFDLDYLTDSLNYQPVRLENQANKHAGPQEANQNTGTKENIDVCDSPIEAESAQDYFVLPIWSSYTSTFKSSKASEEPTKHLDIQQVDKENQVFLDELERLKIQEQDANNAAEALRKEFAQEIEDLLLQAGTAKASSTNIVNTASTPVSTASPYDRLSFTDLTNTEQDDSKIPALEKIYANPTDGIFTNSSYYDEGV
ncbi:putative ribonuclease H-like domain-containing protein, partial [Tanacetum coccineum]